jgi:Ca-activated chloride channel family protein
MARGALVAAWMLAVVTFAQEASFRADVQLVNVSLSVRDPAGRLAPGLTKDDFEVWEDGARQAVSFFSPSSGLPLALGLLVDGSGSQEGFAKQHRKDLRDFLRTVMTPRDQAFLVGFGNRLKLLSDFTARSDNIQKALELYARHRDEAPRLGPRERRILGTAFYDAIYHAINEKLNAREQRRKGLIVFSDGEDNASAYHMLETIEMAQMAGVPLFCVRYTGGEETEPNARNKYGMSVMRRMALETGGADFDAVSGNMKEAFAAIGDQLRSSYELAYLSSNPERDGTFRKVVIRPRRPDLKVRHKTGYYAR